jgi:hypothetical protein
VLERRFLLRSVSHAGDDASNLAHDLRLIGAVGGMRLGV